VNAPLTSLALGGNEMRTGGGVALAAALRRNTTLKELDLDSSLMGEQEIVNLIDTLSNHNTTLAKLHLRCMLPLAQLALTNAFYFDPGLTARISTAPRPA
jgi:hypothetical protein